MNVTTSLDVQLSGLLAANKPSAKRSGTSSLRGDLVPFWGTGEFAVEYSRLLLMCDDGDDGDDGDTADIRAEVVTYPS